MKLPDSAIVLIQQIASDTTRAEFGLGEVTAALVDELYPRYGKGVIRRAIANEYGCAEYTVRDRERVYRLAAPYLPELEPLGFRRVREVQRFGEDWYKVACRLLTSADDYGGRFAPLPVIQAWLDERNEIPRWQRQAERLADLAYKIAESRQAPPLLVWLCDLMYQVIPRAY